MKSLKQAEAGLADPEFYREFAINRARYYKWQAKFRNIGVSMVNRIKNWKMRTHAFATRSRMSVLKLRMLPRLKRNVLRPPNDVSFKVNII